MTIKVSEIQIGDVILPPERELRLWMRRHIAEHGMSESALNVTVKAIGESSDKGGAWVHFTTEHTDEWNSGRPSYPFKFKARPETPWQIVSKSEGNEVYMHNGYFSPEDADDFRRFGKQEEVAA